MTFSICVREAYTDDDGEGQFRFGIAVTTRLPGVGTLCPFASENGAVATQSLVNVDLGRTGIEYLGDGVAVEDALQALLNADDGAPTRQLHGVDRDGTFAFSGEDCKPWFGHVEREGFTVAGNLLVGESVVDATADAYAADRPDGPDDEADAPLAERLIDALAAGQAEGGDKREELHVQSAALLVETTEDLDREPYYNDLRVDASETPIEELRATYELAAEGDEQLRERYDDESDADSGEESDTDDGESDVDGGESDVDGGESTEDEE